ncbi:HAD-IA family hydrolase [Microbaculum marinisediminis]|uniref:HAD-IA family hydrolase n=1 Tax=Microbaculum marinisediminis TaxID=2931392 RepID=A0AAW5R2H8_9HYPH|nr:HAD-IA family hydrolase [Microbaculum sp. A6E488]MCT8974481.1 HAD-IA family hydrolase [Microbaculum sp. A6E488]
MRLILFDCDGTLVDSQNIIVSTMHAAFAMHGIAAPSRDAVLAIVGLSLEQAIATLLGDQADRAAEVAVSYREQFQSRRQDGVLEPLYPGAREVVTALASRDDTLLGIVTGKSRRGVDAVLGGHGLLDCFVTIQTADDAPSKPHPAMVLQALSATGADAAHTVVIGDTTYDMMMARSAGTGAVGVSWGYHAPQTLPEAGAEIVLTRFDDLPPWLERRWAASEIAA